MWYIHVCPSHLMILLFHFVQVSGSSELIGCSLWGPHASNRFWLLPCPGGLVIVGDWSSYTKPLFFFQPLLREAYEANPHMSEAEARGQLERCLKILYYRDGRSWDKVSLLFWYICICNYVYVCIYRYICNTEIDLMCMYMYAIYIYCHGKWYTYFDGMIHLMFEI